MRNKSYGSKFCRAILNGLDWSFQFIRPEVGWAITKRMADALEKLAVAGFAIIFFGQNSESAWIGGAFMLASIFLTALIARYKP